MTNRREFQRCAVLIDETNERFFAVRDTVSEVPPNGSSRKDTTRSTGFASEI